MIGGQRVAHPTRYTLKGSLKPYPSIQNRLAQHQAVLLFRLPKRGGDIGSLKMRPRVSTACLQAVLLR